MFLARTEIERLATEGKLFDKNYHKDYVRQASYDLRLGAEVYIVGKNAPEMLTDSSQYLTLAPGQFALLTCYEHINLQQPIGEQQYMAFISLRSTFKFQGLVNISGFHVDPTHVGTLLFAVQNVGPSDIRLRYKEPTFTIFFAKVDGNIGKFRKEETSTEFKPRLEGIRLQDVQVLGGASVTISELRREIDQLKRLIQLYGPIIVAALIAFIVDLIKTHK